MPIPPRELSSKVELWQKFGAYVRKQAAPFDRSVLWSTSAAREGLAIVFWWALPAFLIVILVKKFGTSLPSQYLEAAISEGIGPHLWNFIGTLGLQLAGLSLIVPRSRVIAKGAYHVLINTYAIGALSLGLVLGQFIAAVDSANVEAWQKWLFGFGGTTLCFYIFLLNFSLWYLGGLMASRENADGFMSRVETVDFRVRLFCGLFVGGLPSLFLFLEK